MSGPVTHENRAIWPAALIGVSMTGDTKGPLQAACIEHQRLWLYLSIIKFKVGLGVPHSMQGPPSTPAQALPPGPITDLAWIMLGCVEGSRSYGLGKSITSNDWRASIGVR